jgi:hypothetical protein
VGYMAHFQIYQVPLIRGTEHRSGTRSTRSRTP